MIQKDIGYIIKAITDRIKVKADADLLSHGLTLAQSRVLGFLDSRGGSAALKEIEAHLGVAHPTASGIVSRMERSGFLESAKEPGDLRTKTVRMTEKARLAGINLRGMIDEQETRMTSGLTDSEVAELRRMLSVVYRNLN